jgi:hypothetical protein
LRLLAGARLRLSHALLLSLAKRFELRLPPRLQILTGVSLDGGPRGGSLRLIQTVAGSKRLLPTLFAFLFGAVDFGLLLHLAEHPLQDGDANDDPKYPLGVHALQRV